MRRAWRGEGAGRCRSATEGRSRGVEWRSGGLGVGRAAGVAAGQARRAEGERGDHHGRAAAGEDIDALAEETWALFCSIR